jgi:NADPH-dependent ferric siderophore reductase
VGTWLAVPSTTSSREDTRPVHHARNATLDAMSVSEPSPPTRIRREPPSFRRVVVRHVVLETPRLARVTLAGPELAGFAVEQPAASVRLLLPSPAEHELVIPTWNGNEFLLPDGRRPTIRTLTPWRFDTGTLELDVGVVIHGGGAASEWVSGAQSGDGVAVSGPGRGYTVDPNAPAFLLAGDETAIPAITQLLDVLPGGVPVQVRIELADPDARFALPDHPAASVEWCDLAPGAPPGDAVVAAIQRAVIVPGTKVWVAGEAAAVQRIRRHLFEELALPRGQVTARGYWKSGRAADSADES